MSLPDAEFTAAFEELKRRRRKKTPINNEVRSVLSQVLRHKLTSDAYAPLREAGVVETSGTEHPMHIHLQPISITYVHNSNGPKAKDFDLKALVTNIQNFRSHCSFGMPYKTLTSKTTYKKYSIQSPDQLGSHVEFKFIDNKFAHVVLHLRMQDPANNLLNAIMMLFSRGKLPPRCVYLIVENTKVTKPESRKVVWSVVNEAGTRFPSPFTAKVVNLLNQYLYKVGVNLTNHSAPNEQAVQEKTDILSDAKYFLQNVMAIVETPMIFDRSLIAEFWLRDLHPPDNTCIYIENLRCGDESYVPATLPNTVIVILANSGTLESCLLNTARTPSCFIARGDARLSQLCAQFVNDTYFNLGFFGHLRCLTTKSDPNAKNTIKAALHERYHHVIRMAMV